MHAHARIHAHTHAHTDRPSIHTVYPTPSHPFQNRNFTGKQIGLQNGLKYLYATQLAAPPRIRQTH